MTSIGGRNNLPSSNLVIATTQPAQFTLEKGNSMSYRNDKGSALVEMALILPLLILLVVGICEFGWAMYVNNTLNHAAREGARLAAVTPTPIDVQARVRECITFPVGDMNLQIVTAPSAPVSGNPVTVSATVTFHTFTGVFPFLDGMQMRGEATMRYEL